MKQNDTKYHQLFLILKEADDYFPKESRKELLSLIKEMYNEYKEIIEEKDNDGKYGISYNTIGEDSFHPDKHEQFFITKEKRDKVFEDWFNDRYWDNILDDELHYRTPSPNLHNVKKIFKEGGKIYEEL